MSDADTVARIMQELNAPADLFATPLKRGYHNSLSILRRSVWMQLRRLGWSYTQMGDATNCDHSTVLAAVKRGEDDERAATSQAKADPTPHLPVAAQGHSGNQDGGGLVPHALHAGACNEQGQPLAEPVESPSPVVSGRGGEGGGLPRKRATTPSLRGGVWTENPYAVDSQVLKHMRSEDRCEWLMDLFRIYRADHDSLYPEDIMDALELMCRSGDPTWHSRKLAEDPEACDLKPGEAAA